MLKLLEAHNGLSALLVEKSNYDGIWVSSLTHAAAKGLPDNELISLKERIDLVREIKEITTKPIVVDIDTGGNLEHLPHFVRGFRDAGAYAVVIEDKKYPKQNSLLEENAHQMEDVDVHAKKIKLATQNAGKMLIIARLESLIAKRSMEDALLRATAYIDAGADVIMIHSKAEIDADEVMEFAKRFRKSSSTMLMAIPTTYILPDEHPFGIVVEANQLLRVSLAAMKRYTEGEAVELATVKDIFNLVGH